MTAHGELPTSVHAALPESAILTSKGRQECLSTIPGSSRVVRITRNVVLDQTQIVGGNTFDNIHIGTQEELRISSQHRSRMDFDC